MVHTLDTIETSFLRIDSSLLVLLDDDSRVRYFGRLVRNGKIIVLEVFSTSRERALRSHGHISSLSRQEPEFTSSCRDRRRCINRLHDRQLNAR